MMLSAGAALAGTTKLEGEYQIQLDLRKQDRRFVWDFDSNNNDTFNNMQFRLFSQPTSGVEAFTKFEAEWNTGSNGNRRPKFQFREAHLRFHKKFGGREVDSYLFSRQNRYWVDNQLIRVVEGDPVKDGDNAQAARADLRGWLGKNSTVSLIASDFSSQSNPGSGSLPGKPVPTDDAYIGRVRKEWLGGLLRTGMTWNRKNVRFTGAEPIVTEVWAADARYRWGNTDLSLEYAEGQQRNPGERYLSDDLSLSKFSFKRPGRGLPDDAVVRGEIRSLQVGNPTLGYLNVAPSFWYVGPQFRNQLGNVLSDWWEQLNGANSDETGYWINSWYLVPGRAVTITNNYMSSTKRVDQSRHFTEFFSEAYIEYVNGFTSKFFYRDRRTRTWVSDGAATLKQVQKNRDLFAELQVESRLAWMRVQFRIRDLDTVFQKELSAIETSVNVSEGVKVYSRFTFGDDPARSRKGLYTQIQYRPRHNLEAFLSYGPDWIGAGSNPVFEGNLQGGADNKDIVKFILKGTF